MKIARLKENNILEIKDGEVERPEDAQAGFGWYNYEVAFGDVADVLIGDQIVVETKAKPSISIEEVKQDKIGQIKANTRMQVLNKYSYEDQIDASLGIVSASEMQDIKDFIAAHRNGAKGLIQQVKNCDTKEEVDNITNIYKEEE